MDMYNLESADLYGFEIDAIRNAVTVVVDLKLLTEHDREVLERLMNTKPFCKQLEVYDGTRMCNY